MRAMQPDPNAPTDPALLPAYWDERRRRQGKTDLSTCAADLRVALAAQREAWRLERQRLLAAVRAWGEACECGCAPSARGERVADLVARLERERD